MHSECEHIASVCVSIFIGAANWFCVCVPEHNITANGIGNLHRHIEPTLRYRYLQVYYMYHTQSMCVCVCVDNLIVIHDRPIVHASWSSIVQCEIAMS